MGIPLSHAVFVPMLVLAISSVFVEAIESAS